MSSPVDDLHSRYAVDTQVIESFKHDYNIQNLTETRMVSDHAKVLDYVPKPAAFERLYGVNKTRRWAFFNPPPNFSQTRVFFFESFDSLERDDADVRRVSNMDCTHKDAAEQRERLNEKKVIEEFCVLKIKLREDYNYIMGRIHEFVRG